MTMHEVQLAMPVLPDPLPDFMVEYYSLYCPACEDMRVAGKPKYATVITCMACGHGLGSVMLGWGQTPGRPDHYQEREDERYPDVAFDYMPEEEDDDELPE